MPSTPITTPEHAPSITRTTLGITSARDTASPSLYPMVFIGCSASEDD
jgi:hypothetical protein